MTNLERMIADVYGPSANSTYDTQIYHPVDVERHLDYFEYKLKENELAHAFDQLDDTTFGKFASQQLKQRAALSKNPSILNCDFNMLWQSIVSVVCDSKNIPVDAMDDIAIFATLIAMKSRVGDES